MSGSSCTPFQWQSNKFLADLMWEDPVIYHSLDKNGAFNNLFYYESLLNLLSVKVLKKIWISRPCLENNRKWESAKKTAVGTSLPFIHPTVKS